ncbi:EAL and HDOD domain-containing protein [Actinotalea sp. C106]|uniref:EAL and HDOD domain-containing protein n=1 Tax=Actinotalea sp. C106 TaxID=2908644 RepID=UPI0020279A4F|nr:HDOD domain-containing protein [Actinotalea sp. C106]
MHTASPTASAAPSPLVPATTGAAAPRVQIPAGAVSTVHRDPVADLSGRVIGYTVAVSVDLTHVPTQQTAQRRTGPVPVPPAVLHEHYLALDLPSLVADRYVFLPATPLMLDGFVPGPVTPGRLVLELPARYEHSDEAVERAAALRALGVHLSLLHYRGEAEQTALLPHLSFVVVDANEPDLPLARLVHQAHQAGVRVLAADVQTSRVENDCRAAGVDGLRGGYGVRADAQAAGDPEGDPPTGPRVLRAGELQCLALMHLLSQPEVDFAAVSQVVDTDPVLTLRVLHLVNSGAFALVSQIDTVHQAVVLLGVREVTTLVSALMLDARPDAMDSLWFILARALACETLAEDSAAYTVGMLSGLAVQLGVPADVILETVGVSDAVADAIRSEEGPYGPVLAAVRAHERHDEPGVLATGLQPSDISAAYVRAVADALETAQAVTRDGGA